MEITERTISRVKVLALSGQLTTNKQPQALSARIEQLLAEGERLFVINLKDCLRMDSMGLGELVKVYSLIEAQQGVLKLAEIPLRLRGLIVVTNLTEVVEIYDTERDAVNSFGN